MLRSGASFVLTYSNQYRSAKRGGTAGAGRRQDKVRGRAESAASYLQPAPSFGETTAEKLGWHRATVDLSITIAESLTDETNEIVHGTPGLGGYCRRHFICIASAPILLPSPNHGDALDHQRQVAAIETASVRPCSPGCA